MPAYYFYFINILFCFHLKAQVNPNNFTNEINIAKLSKGNLLVRLESKENKINFLQKQITAKDCNDKCKARLERQIQEIRVARDSFNRQWINSFKAYFTFCPVYFYYDKDHEELKKSKFKGNFFVDENLNVININRINQDSILILKKDITPNSENEGWLFQTIDGVTLQDGFPYITVNNSKTIFNWISSSNHKKLNSDYLIQKLNTDLYAY
jgi:hypothetical protein